jgi:hypothetical protein
MTDATITHAIGQRIPLRNNLVPIDRCPPSLRLVPKTISIALCLTSTTVLQRQSVHQVNRYKVVWLLSICAFIHYFPIEQIYI